MVGLDEQAAETQSHGTVGDVVSHLRSTKRPWLPDAIEQLEVDVDQIGSLAEGEITRGLRELQEFHKVSYQEIVALRSYHSGFSPFEVNHGVKGAEFENVLLVVGRGWSDYNFVEMLEWAANPITVPAAKHSKYEQNRNLFYVACSRPKKRLAILFTQLLSPAALATTTYWFGANSMNVLHQP